MESLKIVSDTILILFLIVQGIKVELTEAKTRNKFSFLASSKSLTQPDEK